MSIDRAVDSFGEALVRCEALVEQFKSRHAILRNSLSYLPSALAGLARDIEENAIGAELNGVLDSLTSRILLYQVGGRDDLHPQIGQQLQDLRKIADNFPLDIANQINVVANHVDVVLQYRPLVDSVVRELQSGMTSQLREDIMTSYSAHYGEKQRQAALYRVALTAAVVVLTLYVLFFVVRLKRLTLSLDRANEEVTELNQSLEQRVQQRSKELAAANAELVRKERLAALGQLTATVSHELRNPLGALRSSLFVIKGKTEQNGLSLDRPVNRAERSIERCDNIITEMLDFARASEIDPEIGQIDAWLDETISEQVVPAGIAIRRGLKSSGFTHFFR